jgi:anti-anti-sigma factor
MPVTREGMNNDLIVPGFDTESCDFLEIELEQIHGPQTCLALRLKGQIDTYSSAFLLRCAARSIDAGFVRLVLVLDEVEYLSSKAVGTFVQIKNSLAGKGGAFAIVSGNPKTRNVLKNLSLDKFLCCTGSLEDAVAGMTK